MAYTTESGKKLITVIPGDGIGPECIESALRLLQAVNAPVEWEVREAGAGVFKKGIESGVPQETIESIRKTRVVLKGPLETPVGYGEKSANVTLRKLFETYANVRPVREFPNVPTPYSGRGIDLVVVRENVEDLYAGIEHMQTPGVAQTLKIISRKGCEKIVRFAFELARAEGRKKVHCATKANIMKFAEGMLKRTFEEIAPEYPDIEASHIIVDNCAHQLVKRPEQFEVIVTTNMNGDILSDLTSALVGGLGFAPSANIGNEVAIFEAVHGSAPKYAGKNVINPTAVILSMVMMLRYLGEFEAAATIENALLYTLEEGKVRTGDVVGYDKGAKTTEYTDAIIANSGQEAVHDAGARVPPDSAAAGSRRSRVRAPADAARGRRGHLRGDRPVPRAAGTRAGDAGRRIAVPVEDGLQPRHEGLPAHRRDYRCRRPLPLPIHAAGCQRRRNRRADSGLDSACGQPIPLDAHRKVAGVRRRDGLHESARRGLNAPPL
jgi:isocitrate dehydrogenase